MPIYDYVCKDCNIRFEKLVLKPDRDQVLCPKCGKDNLEQQLGTFTSPVKGRFRDTSRPSWAEHPHPEDYNPNKHDD
ncbi:MAG: zinc ribbon domain-containing protein [Acidobacteriia bacterium]|nr:zinc ribbon domain-containing protein [Terriglobia bacterium]